MGPPLLRRGGFKRDLYFFAEFDNQNMQISALRLLCCLLPVPNRDTLKVLLEFLAEVAQCSEDSTDDNGVEVSCKHSCTWKTIRQEARNVSLSIFSPLSSLCLSV